MTSLAEAEQNFVQIMNDLSVKDRKEFFTFITQEWKPANLEEEPAFDNDDNLSEGRQVLDDPEFTLMSIATDIKKKVPFNAVLPSEKITTPRVGENSDCDPKITVSVDGFLYDENDIDDLVEAGDLKQHFCLDCGSKNITEFIYISHSTPRDALYHIFNNLLPTLKNKTILDVGSRLGAVLYGAYVYTDASKIIGVEMNADFCKLQQNIIKKYKMDDRIEILNKKIEEVADVVQTSDVIIINNAFEFYLSESEQIEVWKFLKKNIRVGTILVTRPQMDIMLTKLPFGISVNEWLEPFDKMFTKSNDFSTFLNAISAESEKYSDIVCYKVR